jgi:hypothetical protein
VSLPTIYLNIYKIGHRKTLKMSHLRVFDPPRPRLAPYQLVHPDGSRKWGNSESLAKRQYELHSVGEKW